VVPPVVTITNYLAEIGLLFGFVYHKFSGRESFACAYVNVRYAYEVQSNVAVHFCYMMASGPYAIIGLTFLWFITADK